MYVLSSSSYPVYHRAAVTVVKLSNVGVPLPSSSTYNVCVLGSNYEHADLKSRLMRFFWWTATVTDSYRTNQ